MGLSKTKLPFHLFILALISISISSISCESISYSLKPKSTLGDDVKYVIVESFITDVAQGPANIELIFTEKLKNYIQKNTRLQIVDKVPKLENDSIPPHLIYSGAISSYNIRPISSTGGNTQQATQQRITITVKVSYENTSPSSKQKPMENRSFSFYDDFDASLSISDIEDEKVDLIFDQIITDVFNTTIAAW